MLISDLMPVAENGGACDTVHFGKVIVTLSQHFIFSELGVDVICRRLYDGERVDLRQYVRCDEGKILLWVLNDASFK